MSLSNSNFHTQKQEGVPEAWEGFRKFCPYEVIIPASLKKASSSEQVINIFVNVHAIKEDSISLNIYFRGNYMKSEMEANQETVSCKQYF